MSGRGIAGTLIWALGVLVAITIVARATYTADLSAFLPRAPSTTERLLVEQLRTGPAARLIIAAIEGADPRARADVSARLAQALRADPAFAAVNNGDAATLEDDRQFLFRHRYLLSPEVTQQRFTADGLRSAIGDSLDLLASSEEPLVKSLFARDPTGEMLAILDSFGQRQSPHTSAGVWSSLDGTRALLVLETSAPGSDTDGQEGACSMVRERFASFAALLPPDERAGLRLTMSGPPVFAVEARKTIRAEVVRLSCVSALLVAVLLLTVYRSVPALVLGLLPVASGALAGIAAVALGFGAVHGITLGFGVTLIGEAVDYSIYLFIQNRGDFLDSVWPTLRLGVLTSVVGFAALLPSAFPGVAQLGLYSVAGLIAAALVTRFVLPAWIPEDLRIRDLRPFGERLERALPGVAASRAALLAVPVLAGIALYVHRGALLDRELSSLSPVSAQARALDEKLRAESGAPDVGYVVVGQGATRDSALRAAQTLSVRLTGLADRGVIGGFDSPTRYLPGLAQQRARQASLPAPTELWTQLKGALVGLPVKPTLLAPFLLDVEAARTAPELTRADLEGTSFAAAADALLVEGDGGWSALLPVSAAGSADLSPEAIRELRASVSEDGAGTLLDLKGEADRLYAGYLTETVRLACLGFAAIVILLWIALRSIARVARVVAPLALAVLAVAGLLVALGEKLTILHIVGMLLIVAVGSNYALFFDRVRESRARGSVPLTLASLVVANFATVLTFGVLATSHVPVLADLGRTVAPGALLALIFAAILAQPSPAHENEYP